VIYIAPKSQKRIRAYSHKVQGHCQGHAQHSKAKDLGFKANTKAKNFGLKAKAEA